MQSTKQLHFVGEKLISNIFCFFSGMYKLSFHYYISDKLFSLSNIFFVKQIKSN